MRNGRGVVLLHSRKNFPLINSRDDANLIILQWAMESMSSHKVDKVIFATEIGEMVDAIERPQAWPSFSYHVSEILLSLNRFRSWKFVKELKEANKGASLIPQSVTQECRLQSYVATSHPFWLHGLFQSESVLLPLLLAWKLGNEEHVE